MSAAPSTQISVRGLALRAFAESNQIMSRIRRDESKKLLFARLASDRFGLGSIHFNCTEVGFLPDDRAYIDVEDVRIIAPTSSTIAGLFLDDGREIQSVMSLVDIGRILAQENI